MADGDVGFDPDPFPAGTMTAMGLQPNDPLYDWASNMNPSDIQQYVHDPEGFKQKMIDQGQPPPDHHYTRDDNGALRAVQGIVRDPAQGNLTDDISNKPLGYTDYPLKPEESGVVADIPGAIRKNLEKANQAQPYPPDQQPGTPPLARPNTVPPASGTVATPGVGGMPSLGDIWRRGFGTGFDPEPAQRPTPGVVKPPAPAQGGPLAPLPTGQVPPSATDNPAQVQDEVKTAAKELDDKKLQAEKASKALTDFAKSMQGIKMPEAPKLAPPSGLGVRAPTALNPGIANLLALTGAKAPGVANQSLMKLLGRA